MGSSESTANKNSKLTKTTEREEMTTGEAVAAAVAVAAGVALVSWGLCKLINGGSSDKMMKAPGRNDFEKNVDNCVITGRERIKEKSEYKKAQEEELASRQRALAVQAEEAKKLKQLLRRKKAESMRISEMEKRQKQRVDEMRETQKKDIENMNMKELIRAETRKQLCKLKLSCHDMASVLRGLGITVGGGTTPSSHETCYLYWQNITSVIFNEDHRVPLTDKGDITIYGTDIPSFNSIDILLDNGTSIKLSKRHGCTIIRRYQNKNYINGSVTHTVSSNRPSYSNGYTFNGHTQSAMPATRAL